MPSTQFRTTYTSLTTPVEVTVNGHAIGTWLPSPYSAVEFREETASGPRYVRVEHDAAGDVDTTTYSTHPSFLPPHERSGFNTRPFTPVPKKGHG